MINNIGGYRPSSAPRGVSMVRANNRFGEVLAAKANRTDTFSRSSAPSSAISAEQLSSVNETQRKLDKIAEDIKNTDYSGMTKAEIYADIEGRYADAFDDFYMTMAFSTCEDHIMIHEQFLNDVHSLTDSKVTFDFFNESRGYSDMSYDEIENAIKEKYVGKTGFIDQLNLFGELFASGVLSNKYGNKEAINMAMTLGLSVECGGDMQISKDEWLSRLNGTGASSPFDLWVNNTVFSPPERAWFQSIVDDILFGVI